MQNGVRAVTRTLEGAALAEVPLSQSSKVAVGRTLASAGRLLLAVIRNGADSTTADERRVMTVVTPSLVLQAAYMADARQHQGQALQVADIGGGSATIVLGRSDSNGTAKGEARSPRTRRRQASGATAQGSSLEDVQEATPLELVTTAYTPQAWALLTTSDPFSPSTPPSAPPPTAPPRGGCAVSSWDSAGLPPQLNSSVLSVEVVEGQAAGVLPLTRRFDNLPTAGGGACGSSQDCNGAGPNGGGGGGVADRAHNTCNASTNACMCAAGWFGPKCEELMSCSVESNEPGATPSACLWARARDGGEAMECTCDVLGAVSLSTSHWHQAAAFVDFNEDWALLAGLSKNATALALSLIFFLTAVAAVGAGALLDCRTLYIRKLPPAWRIHSPLLRKRLRRVDQRLRRGSSLKAGDMVVADQPALDSNLRSYAMYMSSDLHTYVRSLLVALREQHTVLRLFFSSPTEGATRAQWMMLLMNIIATQSLVCIIFFRHMQPSVGAEVTVSALAVCISLVSKATCRLSFDHAQQFSFWRQLPDEVYLQYLKAMHDAAAWSASSKKRSLSHGLSGRRLSAVACASEFDLSHDPLGPESAEPMADFHQVGGLATAAGAAEMRKIMLAPDQIFLDPANPSMLQFAVLHEGTPHKDGTSQSQAVLFVHVRQLQRHLPWDAKRLIASYNVWDAPEGLALDPVRLLNASQLRTINGLDVHCYSDRLCGKELASAWVFNCVHFVLCILLSAWIVLKRDRDASLDSPMSIYRCTQDYWSSAFLGLALSFLMNSLLVDPIFIALFFFLTAMFMRKRLAQIIRPGVEVEAGLKQAASNKFKRASMIAGPAQRKGGELQLHKHLGELQDVEQTEESQRVNLTSARI